MRILLYDVETTPLKVWTWGAYQADAIEILEHSYILCVGYKWYGEPGGVQALGPTPEYWLPGDDSEAVHELWDLFDQADVVVGHNAAKFDNRKANARFAYYGLGPPSPYHTVDTLKLARKHFAMARNRLDDLGDHLDLGRKTKHQGWDLWKRCMKAPYDKPAWDKMLRYCKQDVVLLEKLYTQLRGWDAGHPTLMDSSGCPTCGSTKLQRRGYRHTKTMTYQQYHCQNCGAWSRSRIADRDAERPDYVR